MWVSGGDGFDGDAERLAHLGQTLAPVAEIARCESLNP